jgi:hypothetical protein
MANNSGRLTKHIFVPYPIAPTVEGTPTQWANTSVWEDPFIWQDTAGHLHMICCAYPPVVEAKCGECALHYGDVVAGHGFSKDGTPGS